MENVVTVVKWLKRGRQRSAVAQALRKPMIASQIWQAARQINSRIQLRDVWFILRQLMERKLVVCLNPRRTNGRLFYLTDEGRQLATAAFGVKRDPLPESVNWQKYGDVVRGKTRRLILDGLGRLAERTGESQTAANVRKFLRNGHAVGLNPVIRALRELEVLGLIRNVAVARKQKHRRYTLTPGGRRIVELLHGEQPKYF